MSISIKMPVPCKEVVRHFQIQILGFVAFAVDAHEVAVQPDVLCQFVVFAGLVGAQCLLQLAGCTYEIRCGLGTSAFETDVIVLAPLISRTYYDVDVQTLGQRAILHIDDLLAGRQQLQFAVVNRHVVVIVGQVEGEGFAVCFHIVDRERIVQTIGLAQTVGNLAEL